MRLAFFIYYYYLYLKILIILIHFKKTKNSIHTKCQGGIDLPNFFSGSTCPPLSCQMTPPTITAIKKKTYLSRKTERVPGTSADTKERMSPCAVSTYNRAKLRRYGSKNTFSRKRRGFYGGPDKRPRARVCNGSIVTCHMSVLTWSLASPYRCITRLCRTRASVASSSSGHGSLDDVTPHTSVCVQTFYHNSANPLIKRPRGVMHN